MMLFNLEEKQNARSAQQDQTEEKSGIIELASVEKDGFTISWGLKTQKEKMQAIKPATKYLVYFIINLFSFLQARMASHLCQTATILLQS